MLLKLWRLALLLDHLVLFVDDLPAAITRFESKGFTVTPGGTNGPTHNALIVFSNDTYIELIALQTSKARSLMKTLRRVGVFTLRRCFKRDLQTRLLNWMSGSQGFIDMCLRGTDLSEISEPSPLWGMDITDPVMFKRYRPDGVIVQWILRGSNNLRQPFFIQDTTPIDYRIPKGEARIHPNGALGISEVRTAEPCGTSASNVRIKHDPSLQSGLFSVTIVNELEVTDHIRGPDFFNADIHLLPQSSS